MNASVADLVIAVATADDAAAMVEVIHAAFGARPPLDPPSTAIDETAESVSGQLAAGGGIYAEVDGPPAGSIVVTGPDARLATFQRVWSIRTSSDTGSPRRWSTPPWRTPPSSASDRVELFAAAEFDELIAFWQHRGFAVDSTQPHG